MPVLVLVCEGELVFEKDAEPVSEGVEPGIRCCWLWFPLLAR